MIILIKYFLSVVAEKYFCEHYIKYFGVKVKYFGVQVKYFSALTLTGTPSQGLGEGFSVASCPMCILE